jgi:SHS2 domain-containing protein
MAAYQLKPHTADIRLLITGGNPEELFTSALQGMSHIQKNDACRQGVELTETEIIQVTAPDNTALLIDFLSEILTLCHINKSVYCAVKFKSLTERYVSATIYGAKVDGFDEDIKAVTYHGAEVTVGDDKSLRSTIVFDI